MPQSYKSVVAVDLGASTLRMRLSRFAPEYPLRTVGDVVLPLDSLQNSVRDIAVEEALIGPKRLLEMSAVDPSVSGAALFCPNPECTLARREWPSTALVCALCRTRLVPRTALVSEEMVGHAVSRALFELERTTKRAVRPDIAIASAPIDWDADVRYRYLDFLKASLPGAEVRIVDDPLAILRGAAEDPDRWKLPGIVSGDRVIVIDSGARRTQFYTAVASPRIGFFDAAFAVDMWGGLDCDTLITNLVARHLNVDCDVDVKNAWSRPIRLWKEALSTSIAADPAKRSQKPPVLHLPIGGGSAESIDAGPPAKTTASILSALETYIEEVVERGLRILNVSVKVDAVLLTGGNARWPFFDDAVRRLLPDTTIVRTPEGHNPVVCGLPCTLHAETVAWKLGPAQLEEIEDEEEQAKVVPTITELFAAAPSVDTDADPGHRLVPSPFQGEG